jgi:hypothetical protein
VAFAAFPGWFAGAFAGGMWMILEIGAGRGAQRDLVVAFLAICLGVNTGLVALSVREVQQAMVALGVGRGELTRGILRGNTVAAVATLLVWAAIGFKGPYMMMPVLGVAGGAWLSARHISPFGEVRAGAEAAGVEPDGANKAG